MSIRIHRAKDHGKTLGNLAGVKFLMPGGACPYLLRATFDAPDQGFVNGQVLDTVAEGVQVGSLTVVEVDGTIDLNGDRCRMQPQGTPTWGDLGAYSQQITRALGRIVKGQCHQAINTTHGVPFAWVDSTSVATAAMVYDVILHSTGWVQTRANAAAELPAVTAYAGNTNYQFAIALGSYSATGVPWDDNEAAAGYLYGDAVYVRGGVFGMNWTLLWRSMLRNDSPMRAAFSNYNANLYMHNICVPDYDYSLVHQPTCKSTFDAPNGTSLDAIVPEVGGAWTEQSGGYNIQNNRANPDAFGAAPAWTLATVDSGIADFMADVVNAVGGDVGSALPEGLVLRWSDNNNFWRVGLDRVNLFFEIDETNGGVTTTRVSVAYVASYPHDIRAIVYGQTIDAFLDGGNKLTWGIAVLNETATKHGIGTRRPATAAEFDNFAIYARTSTVYDDELSKC